MQGRDPQKEGVEGCLSEQLSPEHPQTSPHIYTYRLRDQHTQIYIFPFLRTHLTGPLHTPSLTHLSNFAGCLVCAGPRLRSGELPSYPRGQRAHLDVQAHRPTPAVTLRPTLFSMGGGPAGREFPQQRHLLLCKQLPQGTQDKV